MDKVFALIKTGRIVNTIVCNDESFLEVLQNQELFEVSVRIDGCEIQPSIGWSYTELGDDQHHFENESRYVVISGNQVIEHGTIDE